LSATQNANPQYQCCQKSLPANSKIKKEMKIESPHITSGMTIMPPIVGTTHTAEPLAVIVTVTVQKTTDK